VKATLELINQMQADGVIEQYAIGGAVGATFYLEPAATLDVDVFVTLPGRWEASLVSLGPVYDYLTARGCAATGEHILIGGWPVQFLVPTDALEREALDEASGTTLEGERTRVMSAEHLVAIALRTGRNKDHLRILQFLERRSVNRERLQGILERHRLTSKWQQFSAKFLEKGL
jgi:hypothetical protein